MQDHSPIAAPAKSQKKSDEAARPATAFARVLIRPHLSEKAVMLAERGTYVFEVATDASAEEIKKAVHAIYAIRPTDVHIAHVRGRAVRFGRTMGTTNEWKKAMVTLPKGKKLDIYG